MGVPGLFPGSPALPVSGLSTEGLPCVVEGERWLRGPKMNLFLAFFFFKFIKMPFSLLLKSGIFNLFCISNDLHSAAPFFEA